MFTFSCLFTVLTVCLLFKNTLDDEGSAISNDILKMPHGTLEMERPMKLFDMKKFQQVLYAGGRDTLNIGRDILSARN